jgi:hypothetical protein
MYDFPSQSAVVDFSTELLFDAEMTPARGEVDGLIISAFGQKAAHYQAQLTALVDNIFSTTTSFTFQMINGSTVTKALKRYQIGYAVDLEGTPSTSEMDGVLNVTQQFVSSHFRTLYPTTVGIDTRITDSFVLNALYEIVYSSDIAFPIGSLAPSFEELNSNLQTAFTGGSKADYLSRLSDLGPDNVFCT